MSSFRSQVSAFRFSIHWGDEPRHRSGAARVSRGMKTLLLLGTAVCSLVLTGCGVPVRGSAQATYSTRTEVVFGDDDYDYYPGYETYYSRTHGYYYYRDGSNWVRRNDPPRAWVSGSASVQMHFKDAPDRHHAEVTKQYPRNWHPAPPKVSPEKNREHDDHDKRDDRDHDHDRK